MGLEMIVRRTPFAEGIPSEGETARKIVLSSFLKNLPENEIRKRLFLRFYGNDFSDEEKEKILISLVKVVP